MMVERHATQPTPSQSLEQLRRQLTALCRQVRWTEWELLSILAGLPPTPPTDAPATPTPPARAPATTRQQLLDEAARREAVRRHVDDAIAEGELRVNRMSLSHLDDVRRIEDLALRTQLENAVYANTLYGQRYTVRPAVAIRWFLDRRELFPECPLRPEHLAIGDAPVRNNSGEVPAIEDVTREATGPQLEGLLEGAHINGEQGDAKAALRSRRYALIDAYQKKRGLSSRSELYAQLGMSKDTVEGIVRDETKKYGQNTKKKLLATLGVSSEQWNGRG